MLKKVSADDVSSYQSYAIRRLDQWRSIVPDSEQYKPLNRKEDAISNKLKYLNTVLSHCFRVAGLVVTPTESSHVSK